MSKIYGGEINQHTSIKFSQAEDEEINLIANDLELTETKFSSTCQNKGFEPSDSHFTGQKTIKEDIISNLNCFIDKSVLANIVNQLNLYEKQTNPDQNDNFTVNFVNVNKIVGIIIMTSLIQIPNVRRY